MSDDDRPDPSDALKTYRARRRFGGTPEPAGGGVANEDARAFVIQKHWATRLHYDFRLELDGTMKSWAVPKGPSVDPQDKRMAMPTEDHPIAYNRFEGTIPAGHYGAGKVIVWDKGVWLPIGDPRRGWREGRLKFELRGHKLRGHWTLVRMTGRGQGREDPWLLIKERDAYARPAAEYSVVDAQPDSVSALEAPPDAAAAAPASGPPAAAVPAGLPDRLQPQLATLAERPPADAQDWLYEIKFDGYRMLARAQDGQLRLITRNGNDWTGRLPELHAALQAMDLPDGWYDGEIILPGAQSPSDFQALQGAFDSARTGGIVYYLFDLPYCAGYDLRPVPLQERRAVLRRIVERKPQPRVRFSEVFEAAPQEVLASACRLGLEGVIAKRRQAAYVSRRSADWLKLKCGQRQEFVVAGFTDPKGSRTGIGSLLLGIHDAQGRLAYVGNVGTGFDDRTLAELRRRLDALATDQPPFAAGTGWPRGSHWVRPELVAQVAFGEWTREGRIRHPVFHGLRSDKPARAITREVAQPPAAPQSPPPPKRGAAKRARAATVTPAVVSVPLPPGLKISHPERIVDPSTGATKLDLVRHYAAVAPLMMEHLRDRPIALVRAPDGIGGQLFFQKHLERYRMPGVVQLDPALVPGHPPMLKIDAPDGLLSAAQMNMVEIHTWNGLASASTTPDRMTFDLDPGEGVGWPQMQEAAQLVRALLTELALPAWLKTSGGKGLHVVVPLQPEFGWDAVKDFSQAIVQHLAGTLPQRFVAKSGPKNRVGRIFIDYLRNGFGATTVAAWSARARPGLGISVPVRWDELPGLRSGAHWTLGSVRERLAEGNAPWDGYAASSVSPRPAMQALGFRPK